MTPGPFALPPDRDPVGPAVPPTLRLVVDGEPVEGLTGQTIAGVLLGSGRSAWGRSPRTGRPRGVFCGIGVCFDCVVVLNGLRDVRACRRRARDGDVVDLQDGDEGA